ncbi:translesion error-prone DNA polymerase V autoproteolytic subunit (plasmid) [Xylophilus rhododendri]|uniref:Translesion error-prone DNA polymerase V autoproteolytic subunit n=1 Tax=Xylophilus rhododendri TaxID=2697032 RepID=A0A857JFY4_9BURK|nr:translesion error-prone DNA polymerase V autoproteolytic subunit [Xylophilus rhododendri]QHJ01749.1 translesion error-prone DNA polymerase V autoproteolytic subunit [Xylophilus rhododendri]
MPSPALLLPGHPVPIAAVSLFLPLAGDRVQAGFPSPAEDFNCKRIDLTEQLVQHPQATFLLRVRGDSMREAGIFDGDVLVVDRAIRAAHGHIVVAVLDAGDFTVKHLVKRAGQVRLVAANPTYPDIVPREGQTLVIWGVVTASIKQFKA